MKEYLLAHDLGTSGNKATLFSLDGKLIKSVTASYSTKYMNNNWAEQNPLDWWVAVCDSTKQLLEGLDASKVASVAFSGQMMGCLVVDKEGRPLRDHMLYCDQRSTEEETELVSKISQKEIYAITGHRLSASYSTTKLMWIKKHQPDIYAKTYKMLNAKDYINYLLTDRMVTDYNDASGTNAFDLSTMKWSEKIIQAAGVDYDKYPEVVPSATVIGEITTNAAKFTGLRAGTPVVVGAGDGGCATVGIGSVKPGITYNYLGSSSWISTTSESVIQDDEMLTFTWAHPVEGYLQPCGTMQTAGSSYSWLKDNIALLEKEQAASSGASSYELINAVIADSPVGANGLLFLPYLLGERSPRWNPDAKGSFIGLSLEHTRADVFRSVLEGVTLNLGIILDVFKAAQPIEAIRVIGGGAQGALWCQIMADIYGVEVQVPNYLEEATSMGAAIIGGVGVGVLDSFHDVERFIEIRKITYPIPSNISVYNTKKKVFNKAYFALEKAGIFDMLKHN